MNDTTEPNEYRDFGEYLAQTPTHPVADQVLAEVNRVDYARTGTEIAQTLGVNNIHPIAVVRHLLNELADSRQIVRLEFGSTFSYRRLFPR